MASASSKSRTSAPIAACSPERVVLASTNWVGPKPRR
jgi:hypothetical protein